MYSGSYILYVYIEDICIYWYLCSTSRDMLLEAPTTQLLHRVQTTAGFIFLWWQSTRAIWGLRDTGPIITQRNIWLTNIHSKDNLTELNWASALLFHYTSDVHYPPCTSLPALIVHTEIARNGIWVVSMGTTHRVGNYQDNSCHSALMAISVTYY